MCECEWRDWQAGKCDAVSALQSLSLQSAALCNEGQQPAPGQGFIATWTGS